MSPFAGYDSFESCTRDNSDKADPEAYCAEIKRQVDGEQSLSDTEIEALERSDCPEGHVKVNDQCMKYTEVENVPQSIMNGELSSPRYLENRRLAVGPIERVEEDGQVRYKSIKVLTEGIWTDASSGRPTHYIPENLELVGENELNLIHDDDNDVSEIGHVENEHHEDGDKYVDFVLHMDNAASEYADENLQKTLETDGAKGFGGPSVEIPKEGLDIEPNGPTGYPKTVAGKIDGVGLVGNQADKNVGFARQTAERAVALSDGQTPLVFTLQGEGMNPEDKARILSEFSAKDLQGPEEVQEEAQSIADTLDVPVGDVMEVLDPLFDMDGEEEEDEEMQEDEEEEEESEDGGEEDEEEEGDDVDIDMDDLANKVESMDERLQNLEDMMEQAMQAEDLEDAKEELADAETVSELAEAKEELEKRLSELEEKPEKPRSLSEDASEGDTPENISFSGEYDSRRNAYSR